MLWNLDRERLFGKFAFEGDPSPDNPERIKVTDDWAKENLVKVELGPLAASEGADVAVFHKLVAPAFEKLVKAWDDAGLTLHVLTWNGSYAPRYKRGRAPAPGMPADPSKLSAHSSGSAFDINAPWNRLGKPPTPRGLEGSNWELVAIAESLGWVWGGKWRHPDAMHFELGALT